MAMDIKSSSSKSSSGFLSTSRLLQHGSAPEAEFSMGTTPYIASPRSTALKALTSRKEDHGFENFKQIDVDQYVTNIQWSIYWRRMNFLYICRMYILYLTYYISIFTATIKWNNQKFPVWPRHSGKGFDTFLFEIWQMIKEATNCHMCQGAFFTWLKENACVTLTGWVRFLAFSFIGFFLAVVSLLLKGKFNSVAHRSSFEASPKTPGVLVWQKLPSYKIYWTKTSIFLSETKKTPPEKKKNTKHFCSAPTIPTNIDCGLSTVATFQGRLHGAKSKGFYVKCWVAFSAFFDPKMGIEEILFPQKCQVFSRIEEDLRRLRDNDGH